MEKNLVVIKKVQLIHKSEQVVNNSEVESGSERGQRDRRKNDLWQEKENLKNNFKTLILQNKEASR